MAGYDYMLLGQGMAGSMLSIELLRRGQKVLMIDDNFYSAASQTATGLISPITGMNLKKAWRWDDFISYAWQTYRSLEEDCNTRFAIAMPILRYFKYRTHRHAIESMLLTDDGEKLIGTVYDHIEKKGIRSYPLGGFESKMSGYLNTGIFLIAIRDFLCKRDAYLEETLQYNDLEIRPDGVKYKEHTAKKLIFCEGYRMTQNPWFSYLPMHPSKGEVLIVQAPDLQLDCILSHDGLHIVPLGDRKLFYVGATYERGAPNILPSPVGFAELLEKFTNVISVDFEIISHGAGIRPGVKDRKPLIGLHPEHPQLALFNGLGSKGVSMAPLLSKMFADFLIDGTPLWADINLARYPIPQAVKG